MSLCIVTLNVNGIADDKKRNAVFCWCRKKKIDIACLQETHCSIDTELKWKNEWGAKSMWNHGSSNSRGVAILFSKTIDYEVTETGRDNTGRKISCVVKISNTYNVNIYNVYVPNLGNDKKIFINQSISMNPADKNIVLGDFNCTLLKSLDRKPIPNRDDIGSTELKKYIERNDLIDVWRARNPNSKCFTFGRVNSHSRIDFIFISSELNFASQKIKIIHFPFSDHDGVIMTLKVSEPERGPGLWKMNYTLFKQIYLST